MARKRQQINPESGKRLKKWMDYIGITSQSLCTAINYTPQYISDIVTGKKRLTPDLAILISNISCSFVHKRTGSRITLGVRDRVRAAYLLLEDDFMTEGDRFDSGAENRTNRKDLLECLLKLHFYEIKDVTDTMPIEYDEEGRGFRQLTYALVSPRGSVRIFSNAQLSEFLSKLDDSIEMQCAFQFRKLLDGVRNIYDWEV
jgi:transcriptional regulator with XRE-family HTH domain